MKFKLAEIRWMQRGLSSITQMKLPIKTSYKLAKLFNFCNNEMQAIEKARTDLVKSLSIPNPEKPGELKVTPENEDKFREEFDHLLQEEIEFEFEPIKLSDIGEDIKISPVELASLAKIIEEE